MALALIGFTACKRNTALAPVLTPKLDLRAAADARADRVGELVLTNPERTLANVGAIAKKLSLPFGDTDLRKLLSARSEVPAGVVERADLSKPAAVVVIVKKKEPGKEGDPIDAVLAFAIKDTSKAGFDAFVAAAGKVIETKRDAVRVQASDAGAGKPMWLLPREGAACSAETIDALVGGCALALEARRPVEQDLRVTLVPEGIARSAGTTLKEAMAKARVAISAQQAQAQSALPATSPKMQAATLKLIESMTGWVLDAVADTTEAHIGLGIDPTKGLSIAFDLAPRPGSAFSRSVADRHPYALDPSLLAGGAPGALWTVGDMTFTRDILAAVRTPLLEMIPAPGDRAKASAAIDEFMGALAGPMSARFSFEGTGKLPLSYDVVYNLKSGTDGKKLLGDMEATLKAPWMGKLMDAVFGGLFKAKIATKREGEALLTQMSFDTKKAPAKMRADLKAIPFLDGTPIQGRTAIVGDKMIMSTGSDSKARLAALLAAPAGAATGDLQAALTETKGDDALYYTDLAAMLKPIIALSAGMGQGAGGPNPMAMAGALLGNAHLAMWGAYRGGPSVTLTGRIPMSTFESIAAIVRGVMGGH